MLWLRSWPADIPPGRRYVMDDLPRLVISGHDLATGWSLPRAREQTDARGFFLVEWDIAYSLGDETAMEERAAEFPDAPFVAPYKLYPVSTGLPGPVWAHSNGELPGETWISIGARDCDHFAFGMVYLPWAMVDRFLAERHAFTDPRFTDTNFSIWHRRTYAQRVRVLWKARPVHLHW